MRGHHDGSNNPRANSMTGKWGKRWSLRPISAVILLVLAAVAAASSLIAQNMPWIVLVLGAATAVLMTAVVETMGRRRDHASALVEERTVARASAIAERELVQAELSRQENMAAIGRLAATVGHELRNPLAVVTNVLYLIKVGAKACPSDRPRGHPRERDLASPPDRDRPPRLRRPPRTDPRPGRSLRSGDRGFPGGTPARRRAGRS